jgi:DNA-binding GntR family transcriptional regulator
MGPRAKAAKTVAGEVAAASPEPAELGGRTWASLLEQSVREDIINGKLPAGSKLRLKELAERYQAGVIPLREALSRLCATGFVLAIDQKGFRVAPLSAEELLDLTRVRQQIDASALHDAIEVGDIAWEAEVVAAHYRLTRIPMVLPGKDGALNPEWEEAHAGFHEVLVSGCRSAWLRRFSITLRDQTARYRFLSLAVPKAARTRDVAAEHEAIVNAIVARNARVACRLLADHFQATTELVLKYMQQQKAKAAPARKPAVATELAA